VPLTAVATLVHFGIGHSSVVFTGGRRLPIEEDEIIESPIAPVGRLLGLLLPPGLARRRALGAAERRLVQEFDKHAIAGWRRCGRSLPRSTGWPLPANSDQQDFATRTCQAEAAGLDPGNPLQAGSSQMPWPPISL